MPPKRKQPPSSSSSDANPSSSYPTARPATRQTPVYPPVPPGIVARQPLQPSSPPQQLANDRDSTQQQHRHQQQQHPSKTGRGRSGAPLPAVQTPVYPPQSPQARRAAAAAVVATSPSKSASNNGTPTGDKMRSSDLVAPEITYHVPHAHQSAGQFSSLVRPHGPSSQPPRIDSRPAPPVVTPVPLPKAASLSTGGPPDRPLQPPPRTDRNIDKVVLGDLCFRTWYPSYYGKEVLGDLGGGTASGNNHKGGGKDDPGKMPSRKDKDQHPVLERLYVCPSCFKYSKELVSWWGHVRVCKLQGKVPGRKVYVHPGGARKVLVPEGGAKGMAPKRKRGDTTKRFVEETVLDEGEWSIWEVDGDDERVSLVYSITTVRCIIPD